MEKKRGDETTWDFPGQGEALVIPIVAVDSPEEFLLDVERGNIKLIRRKYQTRARKIYVLARVDFSGPPHRNPTPIESERAPQGFEDYVGMELSDTHLHLYREGWGNRWAIPLEPPAFHNADDPSRIWADFMKFCNITEPPDIQGGLF